MQRKPQLHVSAQKRTFYDRKILHYGYSTTVSMGKIIPKDWTYARVRILEQDKSRIVVEMIKLLGSEPLAQNQKTHTRNRQDT